MCCILHPWAMQDATVVGRQSRTTALGVLVAFGECCRYGSCKGGRRPESDPSRESDLYPISCFDMSRENMFGESSELPMHFLVYVVSGG